jgi:hypothetical protein
MLRLWFETFIAMSGFVFLSLKYTHLGHSFCLFVQLTEKCESKTCEFTTKSDRLAILQAASLD